MIRTEFTEQFGVRHPIACGGMTGLGTAELIAPVAEAGALGFLTALTDEAPIHENVKQQIVANDECDTIMVFRQFHNSARVVRNSISEQVAEIGARPGATFADVAQLASGKRGREKVLGHGDMEDGMWWAGQDQGLLHDVLPVRDLVDQIIADAEEIIAKRLASMVV